MHGIDGLVLEPRNPHFSMKPQRQLAAVRAASASFGWRFEPPAPGGQGRLSLQLPLHDGVLSLERLLGDGLADVDALVPVHLEGELDGSVLGLGDPAVG